MHEEDYIDPTKPLPRLPHAATVSDDGEADLADLLSRQLTIVEVLQSALLNNQADLSTKEMRDLAGSASTLLGLSHRTEAALSTISTYRSFVSVVLEFLKSRSDSLGEDLLGELRKVGQEMRAPADTLALIE